MQDLQFAPLHATELSRYSLLLQCQKLLLVLVSVHQWLHICPEKADCLICGAEAAIAGALGQSTPVANVHAPVFSIGGYWLHSALVCGGEDKRVMLDRQIYRRCLLLLHRLDRSHTILLLVEIVTAA